MTPDGWDILDVSGDTAVIIRGRDLPQLVRNAAACLTGLVTGGARPCRDRRIHVNVDAGSVEELIVRWLNELVYRYDAEGFVAADVELATCESNRIVADIAGGSCPLPGVLVKAATYHDLSVSHDDSGWTARVTFDL